MFKFLINLTLIYLFLLSSLISISARTSVATGTLSRVPTDSVLVLSVDGKKMISKSRIFQNTRWNPLLERIEENGSPIRKWFSDSNQSGIAWEEPL